MRPEDAGEGEANLGVGGEVSWLGGGLRLRLR